MKTFDEEMWKITPPAPLMERHPWPWHVREFSTRRARDWDAELEKEFIIVDATGKTVATADDRITAEQLIQAMRR